MDNLQLKALFECVANHADDWLRFTGLRWDWFEGVCDNTYELYNLDIISREQMKRVEELMEEWAGRETGYPVPASIDAMHGRNLDNDPADIACFWMWEDRADMYTGTYGRSRREMCGYIARNL